MKYVFYIFLFIVTLAVITVSWLNQVPVVRVLEVQKVNAQKSFEVDAPNQVDVFYVPAEAVVNGKIRLVRAGHVAELNVTQTLDENTPEGKIAVLGTLQDREMAIIPPYNDIPVGAQVRGERLGSGYSTIPIPLVNDK